MYRQPTSHDVRVTRGDCTRRGLATNGLGAFLRVGKGKRYR